MMIIPKDPTGEQGLQKNSLDILAVECPPTNNIKTAIIAMVGDAPNDIELLKAEPFLGLLEHSLIVFVQQLD